MNGEHVVKKLERETQERLLGPKCAMFAPLPSNTVLAQQQHDELRDQGDGKREHGNNDQRNR